MIRQIIKELIKKSIKNFNLAEIKEIKVEHPEEKTRGDYATNIAIVITKQVGKNPLEIAEIISNQLLIINKRLKLFEKVEAVSPGFINFFLSKEYLQKQITEILKLNGKFSRLKIGKRKKVNIEFISANPTGQLHLGHGRGAFFGDCLANVLEKADYRVVREYYINNAKESSQIKELGKTALGKGTTYLTPYLKTQILNLKSKFKKTKNEGEAGFLLTQEIQKDVKNFIVEKLKIKFDNWISEENLYKKNEISKIYKWMKKKDLIYKKEGAEWGKTSKFGDKKDWVIIRKNGEPTYLLSDIAYHKDKIYRKFDKIIDIWGADHQGHVSKIKAAVKMLGFKGDLDILISQVVRLKGGKISKREGNVVTLRWLIDEVGLDAARFIYLTKSLDTQMEFDVNLAKEKSNKSPVYYCQYAHARICSILRKYGKLPIKITNTQNLKLLNHSSELFLIKQLIKFPEIIEDTTKDYQVQRLSQYTISLATSFHQFYRNCRVISNDKKLTQARLSLALAVKIILENTLSLMGISSPEKM